MGLTIRGKKTGETLHGSYSSLHYNTRYLTFVYCGMPDSIGSKTDGSKIDTFNFFMSAWPGDKIIDSDKLQEFMSVLMIVGNEFPQINFHSDCNGNYTKRGKLFDKEWNCGNSIALLKELEKLCFSDELLKLCEKDAMKKIAMEYTIQFMHLVKNEIRHGSGIVEFI